MDLERIVRSLEKQPFRRYENGPNKGKIFWNDEDNTRSVVDFLLRESIGYSQKKSREERVRLIEEKILQYAGRSKRFFHDLGLDGLMGAKRTFLDAIASPFALLKWYAPELFDLSKKDHLHEWEMSRRYWNNEARAREAVDHIMEKSIGYSKKKSRKIRVKLIREKILNHKFGSCKFFYNLGLEGMLVNKRDYLEATSSPLALLKWYDPEIFDLSKKDHIHEWEFGTNTYWNNEVRAREAVDHIMEESIGYSQKLLRKKKKELIEEKILKPEGGSQKFFKDIGLSGLMTSKRRFLESTGSPLALLKWYDPEMFDLSKKDHIHEWEFSSKGYWNDEKKARKAVDHILQEKVGYSPEMSRKEKLALIREEVIGYEGGSKKFFQDLKLYGLVSGNRLFLGSTGSTRAFLKWYAPELFDRTKEDRLQEWEFSCQGYWNDEKKARKAVDHILLKSIGYSRKKSRKERIALIREIIMPYEDGKSLKFFMDMGLKGLMKKRSFLESNLSPIALFKWYDPGLFDLSKKDHIHEWEFSSRNYWNDESNAREAVDHILQESIGYSPKKSRKEKVRLIREKILAYEKGSHEFFKNHGLAGLMSHKRSFLETQHSPLALMKWYDPGLFDLSKRNHIHEWEFSSKRYWSDENNTRKAVDHLLQEKTGYSRNLSRERKKEIFKEKILNYEGGSTKFFYDLGLEGLMVNKRDYLESTGSPLALMKWYLKDDPSALKDFESAYEDVQKCREHFTNGLGFEKIVCLEDIPSLLFSRGCLYQKTMYNGTRKRPDIIFEDSSSTEYEERGMSHTETIIDIKRCMESVKHKSRKRKKDGSYVVGDIEKYIPLCDNLIFMIGEFYEPDKHDKLLEKHWAEFRRHAQPHQTLEHLFVEDVIEVLDAKGHHEAAELYAQAAIDAAEMRLAT